MISGIVMCMLQISDSANITANIRVISVVHKRCQSEMAPFITVFVLCLCLT